MKSWETNVRKVIPYTPGEQPQSADIIKLNTNENPYPPAPGVAKVLRSFDYEGLRRYPAPDARGLVTALAKAYAVTEEEVFVGVGSDDVLAMSFLTFFNSGRPILFSDVTYSFYEVWANLFRIPFEKIPLDENFHYRASDYIRENGGIVIANPNAPTSLAEPLSFVEEVLSKNPGSLVIVDEAYGDFYGQSARSLIHKYDNLLVVGTFSKSRALAGSRIGFAFGNADIIARLNDVKFSFNSYTMDAITLRVGAEALSAESAEYYRMRIGQIVATREEAREKLSALGFLCLPSETNFLFVRHQSLSAKEIFEKLKEHKIFVRHFDAPQIDNYLRITVGTEEEMEILYHALEEMGCSR